MLTTTFILKQPTESQMALSNQVKESVAQATTHLRDALAFAARSEHPVTIASLSELLVRCESIESMDEIMEKYSSFGKSRNTNLNLGQE